MFTCSLLGYQLAPYLRSRHPETAFLDFLHIEQPEWRSGNYPRLSLNLASCLDLTVVVSQHLKTWMTERQADPNRVELCHVNVDTETFKPDASARLEIRTELGIAEHTPIILFAARLSEQKRPDLLLEILRRLETSGAQFCAIIAGDGPLGDSFRQGVRTHNLNQIRLLGEQSSSRVRRLLQAADVFLLPSQLEGISLACYESLSTGLPVICSNVGGQSELVDSTCGRLITPGSGEVESFLTALAELLGNPGLREKLSACARKRITDHFPIDAMGVRLHGLIARAIELRAKHPGGPIDRQLAYSYTVEALEMNRRTSEIYWHIGENRRQRDLADKQLVQLRESFKQRDLQLFWSNNQHFSEQNSAKVQYTVGSIQQVVIPLPHIGLIYLRVDVASMPGLFRVTKFEVRQQTSPAVFCSIEVCPMTAVLAGDAVWVESAGPGVFAAVGPDPQLLLPPVTLPDSITDVIISIEVEAIA